MAFTVPQASEERAKIINDLSDQINQLQKSITDAELASQIADQEKSRLPSKDLTQQNKILQDEQKRRGELNKELNNLLRIETLIKERANPRYMPKDKVSETELLQILDIPTEEKSTERQLITDLYKSYDDAHKRLGYLNKAWISNWWNDKETKKPFLTLQTYLDKKKAKLEAELAIKFEAPLNTFAHPPTGSLYHLHHLYKIEADVLSNFDKQMQTAEENCKAKQAFITAFKNDQHLVKILKNLRLFQFAIDDLHKIILQAPEHLPIEELENILSNLGQTIVLQKIGDLHSACLLDQSTLQKGSFSPYENKAKELSIEMTTALQNYTKVTELTSNIEQGINASQIKKLNTLRSGIAKVNQGLENWKQLSYLEVEPFVSKINQSLKSLEDEGAFLAKVAAKKDPIFAAYQSLQQEKQKLCKTQKEINTFLHKYKLAGENEKLELIFKNRVADLMKTYFDKETGVFPTYLEERNYLFLCQDILSYLASFLLGCFYTPEKKQRKAFVQTLEEHAESYSTINFENRNEQFEETYSYIVNGITRFAPRNESEKTLRYKLNQFRDDFMEVQNIHEQAIKLRGELAQLKVN